jgi:hypothetical protein
MKKILLIIGGLGFLFLLGFGCKKDFLDAKPSSAILQPTTLDDFQSLLENNNTTPLSPVLATMSADEYNFTSYATYQSTFTATEKNSFIWAKDIYAGASSVPDWNTPYTAVFYANSVLAGLDKIKNSETNISRYNFLKGWALFQRAFAYYELVDNFSPVYDANTAATDLGVPIKLNPSVDDLQPRASVQKTYHQILSDLAIATPLLGANIPIYNREQPSKVAAHSLLARIYLNMRKYDLAEKQADSSLQLYSKLIDYNTISLTSTDPFTKINDELIFYKSTSNSYSSTVTFLNSRITISPALLGLYGSNDLRLSLYFVKRPTGAIVSKRQYDGEGTVYPFTGLANDEIYLIKAECAARRNDLTTALTFLNSLLTKRYVTNMFTPIVGTTQTDVLNKVLLERQKELVWRNLRWDDIKRLNKEGANITLTRLLNGQTYSLSPNDPRYVFPIPDNEIQLSGIPQNIR